MGFGRRQCRVLQPTGSLGLDWYLLVDTNGYLHDLPSRAYAIGTLRSPSLKL